MHQRCADASYGDFQRTEQTRRDNHGHVNPDLQVIDVYAWCPRCKYSYPDAKADARLYSEHHPAFSYLCFLPILKTSTSPTIHVIITMMRMKWASLAFSGIGAG
jgi:hypothetical protein